jgi:hypothetical protein
MPKTDFTTAENGFRFSNNDITWSIGFIHAKALCGGMAYAALDYYRAGLEIPQVASAPSEGTPLHRYIMGRQEIAHNNTIPRFGVSYAPIIGILGTELPQSSETKKLGQYIRANKPIPICMVGDMHGHHMVAIGYEERPFAINIYDPNDPKADNKITWKDGHFFNSASSRTWRGFFVDDGYAEEIPTIREGESGWRLCFGCRSLFRTDDKTTGLCCAGGAHMNHFSSNYTLAVKKGHGERGWRRCTRCACLFNASDPAYPGFCPDGSLHNGLASEEYVIARNAGLGQSNWFRCSKCENLFFGGGTNPGKCYDGGTTRRRVAFTFCRSIRADGIYRLGRRQPHAQTTR